MTDTYTGMQRLYMGWAQVWRAKKCEQQTIAQIKADPHSPVKPGEKMYLAPKERVIIW